MTFGKRYLLFELPYINTPIHLNDVLFLMQSQGYKPILAHPERYQFYIGKIEKIRELRERGILMQMNIGSLTGYYSKQSKKLAENMLKEGLVDFLGSDIHNLRHLELVTECLKGKWGKELANYQFLNNSLLND